MPKQRPNPEELCTQIEQEKAELWPDYTLYGWVTARLDEDAETVVLMKAYKTKEFARAAAAQDKPVTTYFFPIFKEPQTGKQWPSKDDVYDYITY